MYAAGLLLYEMLIGEGPFDDLTDQSAQMQAHLSRIPPRIEDKVLVPVGLSEIVARALDKEPDERFATGRDMAMALAPFVAAPWPSRPPTTARPAPRASSASLRRGPPRRPA